MKSILFLLILYSTVADAQNITLFAGGGTSSIGDGGLAISAHISDPATGVFDKYGNYYIASDLSGNRIRKIDTAGIITTIAGTGLLGYNGDNILATSAELNLPGAVALDTAGNLYICEGGGNRIRKIDKFTGIITTFAGNGIGSFSGDSGLATVATINDPLSICFDKLDNLYIADYANYRIRKVSPLGIITTYAGNGNVGYSGDGSEADTSKIGGIASICTDTTGNLYLADNTNSRVFKISSLGFITTVAGTDTGYLYNGDDIPAINANISPLEIKIDDSDNLYIAEVNNWRVRKIDAVGIIHTIAGNGILGSTGDGGLATNAELDKPSGLAFDICGNLYVPEANTGHIRKVEFNTFCLSEGIQTDKGTHTIAIYPNPTNCEVTITSSDIIANITVNNIIGQVAYTQICNNEKTKINIATLPPGVYMVTITDEEGNKTVKKIVKE